jgi:hypothetical protein
MLRPFAGPLLLVLAVAGCATTGETTAAMNTSGPTAKAAGAWSGYAGVGATSLPVSLTLNQTGGDVSGNISIGGRPDFTGPVVGTVQGNALSLKMQSGPGSFSTMVVGQDQITGTSQFGPITLRRAR